VNAPDTLTKTQAGFLANKAMQGLFDLIEAAGGEMRVNGGALRNALLGEPVNEVDLSTTLTPDQVSEVLKAGGVKVVATGIEHGTVTAVAGGEGYEITTLREDVETDGRRAVVRFGTDWRADAARRDFTMNALYCDRQGRLFDPLGGYDDLKARRVRFIGSAEARIAEDYLRILRFFRFFAWYGDGRPDAEGLKACARAKDRIATLSAERVWHELKRLLGAPDPTRAVLWMRTSGVLAAALPETGEWGVDALKHLVDVEKALGESPDFMLRLMAILPPRAERVEALAKRLKLSKREAQRLSEWAGVERPADGASDEELAKHLYRSGKQMLIDALTIEAARERAYQGVTPRAARLAAMVGFARNWQRPVFPLAGADLVQAGFESGPKMGRLLKRLERHWLENGFSPGRDELLAQAKKMAAEAAD
jgi:tRNA nucleotidyltransferase/poly(A) polymerase